MKISGFRRFPRFHEGFGISQGFPNFVWDFKISSEISAKPYEISASGGPLGGNYEWSVRDMAEASVGQATAGETGSCEENKCTSVNKVLYQTIANIKLIKCNTG